MKKFNIFKIKENDYYLSEKINIKEITKDKIKKDIENLIEKVTVNHENMMEEIVKIINLKEYEIGDTSLCHEDNNFIYQICHMRRKYKDSKEIKKENLNCLATTLTTSKETIYQNAVLLCSRINEDSTCTPENIEINDIVNLLYKKFVHVGLLVEPNKVTEVKFRKSPFENLKNENIEDYRYSDREIFGLKLYINGQLDPKPNILNKKMTKLYGLHKVYGKVILIAKTHDYNVTDINKELFNKLLSICEGPMENRVLSKNELSNRKIEQNNNTSKIMNCLNIIEKRYSKYVESNIKNTHKFICQGCFRLRYKTKEEQKNDWKKHSKDCLYKNKNSFDKELVKEELVIRHKEKIKQNLEKEQEENEKAMKEYVTY